MRSLDTKWMFERAGDLLEREIAPGVFQLYAMYDGKNYWQLDLDGEFGNSKSKI